MKRRVITACVSIASTCAYLALAVIGEGGFAAFFAHPALIAAVILTAMAAVAALFTEGSLSSGVREDRSNRWVIIVFSCVGLLQGYLPAWSDRTGFWTIGGDTLRWTGVILYAAGSMLRLWPVFVLGNRFSGLVAIQPGHRLVTGGAYSVVRHPSYLGLLILSLGWAFVFRSGLGLLLTAAMVPPLLARIRSEEKLLSAQFGSEYDTYRRRTWRLVPWIY